MYCHKCGKKLSNDVDFCIYCGAKAIKIEKENISMKNDCTSLNNANQSLDAFAQEPSLQEPIKNDDVTTDDYSIWPGIAFIGVMLIYGLLTT